MDNWQEQFDEKFGGSAPEVAFKNWEYCDAVRAFIQSLLDQQKQEILDKLIDEFETTTAFAGRGIGEYLEKLKKTL